MQLHFLIDFDEFNETGEIRKITKSSSYHDQNINKNINL